MITREQTLQLLHENMQSINLRKHCYAVEAAMRALARHFGEDEKMWGIAGLLHDADYEQTKTDTERHTKLVLEWLEKHPSAGSGQVPKDIKDAILAHGWGFVEGNPEPKNKMEWSLYCVDELTGYIIAVTLIRPERKLSAVTLENLLSKWNKKDFAAGVHRQQVEMCEAKLGIHLNEFIDITLKALQGISEELGL